VRLELSRPYQKLQVVTTRCSYLFVSRQNTMALLTLPDLADAQTLQARQSLMRVRALPPQSLRFTSCVVSDVCVWLPAYSLRERCVRSNPF
jgi:hypothetical protein